MKSFKIILFFIITTLSTSAKIDYIINGDFSYNLCPKMFCIWNTTTYKTINIPGWIPDPQIQIGKGSYYNPNLGNNKALELAGTKNTCVKQVFDTLPSGTYDLTVSYTARGNKKFQDCQFTIYFNNAEIKTLIPQNYLLVDKTLQVKLIKQTQNVQLKLCGSGIFRNDGLGAIITKVKLQGQSTSSSLRKQTVQLTQTALKQIAFNPINLLQNGDLSQNQCKLAAGWCIWNTKTYKSTFVPGWEPDPEMQMGKGNIYNSKFPSTQMVFQLDANSNTCVKQTLTSLSTGSYQLNFDWASRSGQKFADCSFQVYLNDQLIQGFFPIDYEIHKDIVDFNIQKYLDKPVVRFCAMKNSTSDTYGALVTNFKLFKIQLQELNNSLGGQSVVSVPSINSATTSTIGAIQNVSLGTISSSTNVNTLQSVMNNVGLSILTQPISNIATANVSTATPIIGSGFVNNVPLSTGMIFSSTPNLTVSVPTLSVPSVPTPTLSVPSVPTPTLSVPSVPTPTLSVPSVPTPTLSVPSVSLPSVPIISTPYIMNSNISNSIVSSPSVSVPSVIVQRPNLPIIQTNLNTQLISRNITKNIQFVPQTTKQLQSPANIGTTVNPLNSFSVGKQNKNSSQSNNLKGKSTIELTTSNLSNLTQQNNLSQVNTLSIGKTTTNVQPQSLLIKPVQSVQNKVNLITSNQSKTQNINTDLNLILNKVSTINQSKENLTKNVTKISDQGITQQITKQSFLTPVSQVNISQVNLSQLNTSSTSSLSSVKPQSGNNNSLINTLNIVNDQKINPVKQIQNPNKLLPIQSTNQVTKTPTTKIIQLPSINSSTKNESIQSNDEVKSQLQIKNDQKSNQQTSIVSKKSQIKTNLLQVIPSKVDQILPSKVEPIVLPSKKDQLSSTKIQQMIPSKIEQVTIQKQTIPSKPIQVIPSKIVQVTTSKQEQVIPSNKTMQTIIQKTENIISRPQNQVTSISKDQIKPLNQQVQLISNVVSNISVSIQPNNSSVIPPSLENNNKVTEINNIPTPRNISDYVQTNNTINSIKQPIASQQQSEKILSQNSTVLNFITNGDFQYNKCERFPCLIDNINIQNSLSSWKPQPFVQIGLLKNYNPILISLINVNNVVLHLGTSTKNSCIKQSIQNLQNAYYDLSFDYAPLSNSTGNAFFMVKFNGRNIKNILPMNEQFQKQKIVVKAIKGQNTLSFCTYGSDSKNPHGSILDNIVLSVKKNLQNLKDDFIINGDFQTHACVSNTCSWTKNTFKENYIQGWLPQPQIQIGKAMVYNSHAGTSTVAELSPTKNSCIKQKLLSCAKGKFKLQFSWAARQSQSLHNSIFQVKLNGIVLQSFIPNDYFMHRQVLILDLLQDNNQLSFCSYGINDSYGAIIDDVHMYLIDSCSNYSKQTPQKQLQI